jgi:hypothetical protein
MNRAVGSGDLNALAANRLRRSRLGSTFGRLAGSGVERARLRRHAAAGCALLRDVRELVRHEVLSCRRVGCESSRAEGDVRADGQRFRVVLARHGVGIAAGVNADRIKRAPEGVLHTSAQRQWEWGATPQA